MELTPPKPDEAELCVFGRGYGECSCVHIGDGRWAIVDCCLDPRTGEAAPLTYLRSLGVEVAESVVLVVATHWDDDHIAGMGSVVETCVGATVACSAALARDEIFAFVIAQDAARGTLGSGLDELRTVLRTVHQRRQPFVWAKANLPLYPRPPGPSPNVVALSPSEDACERSLISLIEAATSAKSGLVRRYRAPEGPNGASVVTWMRLENAVMLLGGDLEASNNPETGWDAILKYAKPERPASVVKVPHHGSPDAHHDGIWNELATDVAIAVLSPWTLGSRYRPQQADLDRILAFTDSVYLTATPAFRRARSDPEVEKMVRRLHDGRIEELGGWGYVRVRRGADAASWTVELEGDAVRVARRVD